jgi:hypothetical protein
MRISGSTLLAISIIGGVWAKVWPNVSLPIAFGSVFVLALMISCDLTLVRRRPPSA